jgi:hypothetical protein
MELAIVVARRSWFEIYLRKTRKYRKKEKGAYKKEERWHPNSRAQPPRSGDCDKSWTSFLRKGETEVANQVAAPTENEYTQLAPSDNRSTKSADGRVATGAAWLMAGTHREEEKNKNILTGRKERRKKEKHT